MAAVLALVGLSVYKLAWTYPLANGYISRAILGFFVGSLLYLAIRRINATGYGMIAGGIMVAALVVVVVMVEAIGYDAFIGGSGFRIVPSHVLVIFPIVLTMVLTLPWLARILSVRPLTFLGDISYSVYLVHVPVQMIILAVMEMQKKPVPAAEPIFFWIYFATLMGVAFASHRFFEIPVQNLLRRRLLTKR
jgi:peptidoglycan/LPS O-acetylase OafA/YrhL